jgi:hypothetical protein
MKRPKLTQAEIDALLFLAKRCGMTGRITLTMQQRRRTIPLWRRGLVEIWWKRLPGDRRQRGPFFSLSVDGFQLACALNAARDDRRRATKPNDQAQSLPRPSALAA